MDKTAYSRLIIVWHRHKHWHVRSKTLFVLKILLISATAGYISIFLFNSKYLFILLMIVIALRSFYRIAKGDWYDLASQLGLKCWQCDYVFNSDSIVKRVMERNACPKCDCPVYDNSSG